MLIDGVEYVRSDSVVRAPRGPRSVVVVDRGWIFAGDITEENSRIYLDNAVWVFRWEKIGFDGVISNPEKAQLRRLTNRIDIPSGSEIFRVPVDDQWGLL